MRRGEERSGEDEGELGKEEDFFLFSFFVMAATCSLSIIRSSNFFSVFPSSWSVGRRVGRRRGGGMKRSWREREGRRDEEVMAREKGGGG